MSANATSVPFRALARHLGLVLGLVAATLLLWLWRTQPVRAAPDPVPHPYPPTVPCALSVAGFDMTSGTALTVIGSGLGAHQSVALILRPKGVSLGFGWTDWNGAFEQIVRVPPHTTPGARVVGTSTVASCSVAIPPIAGGPPAPSPNPRPSTPSITPTPPATPSPGTAEQPRTGGSRLTSPIGLTILIGTVLLLASVFLLVALTRRRRA
ncbi:MAG: hypothetical protein JWO57_1096 [Pseudonocardiales bacterium]|nr:hypothetical protein [Pseudonocardiales bacterium]